MKAVGVSWVASRHLTFEFKRPLSCFWGAKNKIAGIEAYEA
jgi:hypothetical protein